MTMRPKKTARQWISITVIPFLCVFGFSLMPSMTSAASLMPGQIVFPRAGVSSEAYRTRSSRYAGPTPRQQAAIQSGKPKPARLVPTGSVKPIASHNGIVPVQHQTVQQVDAQQPDRVSVRSELERLYAEEGRQMPRMATPQFPQAQNPANPTIVPNQSAASRSTHQQQASGGLLAGLFDFGRNDRNRQSYSGMPTRPPVEPNPFRPPTYRQQQQSLSSGQQKAMPEHQSPVARQQSSAQSKQSGSVFALRKGHHAPSPRNFAEPQEGFFPEESDDLPTVTPQARSGQLLVEEDHELFFPADVAAPEGVAAPERPEQTASVASDSMKDKLKKLLENRQPAAVVDSSAVPSEDAFQQPALAAEEDLVEPPAAPAVASEVVRTNVVPFVSASAPPAGISEPAPFFSAGERAINPNENMNITTLTGQTFDPSGADSEQTAGTIADSHDAGSRMQQIAAREGVGLKGFCPVALRDHRELRDGRAAFVSSYRSQTYYFSSMAAKEIFDDNPLQYAPAAGGQDVTMKSLTGETIQGSLDHSVWYKDRLYLFHSAENLATFMAAPSAMAVLD